MATPEALDLAYSHCAHILKTSDPDRHMALVFAPRAAQKPLAALHAFNAEIAAIRDHVSEALPGEIRQQWWRDVISRRGSGDQPANPIAQALLDTMQRYYLPEAPILALIDARGFDLYSDLFPDWNALEGYCGETASALIRLSTLILADGDDLGGAALCGHAGVAYALTGLLRSFPIHARSSRCYLPESVLNSCGLPLDDVFEGRDSVALRAALAEMRARARKHLLALDEGVRGLNPRIAPAFYATRLCAPYLRQMERAGYMPFDTLVERAPLAKLWTLTRAAWRF